MSYTAEAVRCEMQGHVRTVADLAGADNRKVAISFAARVLGMPYDRVRRLFYGQARLIEAHEADQIRAYVKQAEEIIQARQNYEQARRQYLENASPFMARLAPPSLEKVK